MAEEKKPVTATAQGSEDVARVFAEIALRSKHLIETRLASASQGGEQVQDQFGVGKAFTELAGKLMSDPFKLAETSLRMWQDYFSLWQSTLRKAAGDEVPATAEPGKSDGRREAATLPVDPMPVMDD